MFGSALNPLLFFSVDKLDGPIHKKKRKKEKKSKYKKSELVQITDIRHIKEETLTEGDDVESVKEKVEEPAHVEAHAGTQALPGAGMYWFSFFLSFSNLRTFCMWVACSTTVLRTYVLYMIQFVI